MAENAPFCTENFKNILRPAARKMRAAARKMRAAGTIFLYPHFSDESYAPPVSACEGRPRRVAD